MRAARPIPFISIRRSPMAPAYYHGRPAYVWITALERRHHRSAGIAGYPQPRRIQVSGL
jgi:hypothetical protein